MRIAVVSQWFPPEKVGIPADIACGMVERGHEVTVLTGFPNYPTGVIYDGWRQRPWLDASQDGYQIRRVATYPSHDSSALRRVANYVSFGATSSTFGWRTLRSADVVYVYHPPLTSALGPWISRSCGGAPYVLHVQDLWPESVIEAGMLRGRALTLAERALTGACNSAYSRAGGVICIAPTMAEILVKRGAAPEKVHMIPNWADDSMFFPVPRDESVVARLGLSNCFSVMFAGNLGHLQGLEVAVRAAGLVQDLPDFRLVIVGEGIARASLEELARSIGTSNVLFVPPQPMAAMNEITRAADVQLVSLRDLPLFRGTIPSKLGAVMAAGLPVICAVNGDASRVVEDSGAGWPCAAEDVSALASAFRTAHASSPEKLAELGSAGRGHYEAFFARRTGVSRVEEILAGAKVSA